MVLSDVNCKCSGEPNNRIISQTVPSPFAISNNLAFSRHRPMDQRQLIVVPDENTRSATRAFKILYCLDGEKISLSFDGCVLLSSLVFTSRRYCYSVSRRTINFPIEVRCAISLNRCENIFVSHWYRSSNDLSGGFGATRSKYANSL